MLTKTERIHRFYYGYEHHHATWRAFLVFLEYVLKGRI